MTHSCSIFISYRRSDRPGYVRALMSDLRHAFGSQQVFLDLETIEGGNDFALTIEQALDGCEILLAVIGPGWLAINDTSGQPRLHDPNDFITLEIASALNRKIPVIPVLVDSALMPKAENFPPALQTLATLQAVELSHDHWDDDMEKLITAINNLTVAPRLARKYEEAKRQLKQGYWQSALTAFDAIEQNNANYGDIGQITKPLHELKKRLIETGPETRPWQYFALRYPTTLILILTLFPHLLAAVFNYLFNWRVIVHPMQLRGVDNAEAVFEMYALSVNSVLFLVGITLLIILARPVTKGLQELSSGSSISYDRMAFYRTRCLRLGHLVALFGLSIWIVAGPIYPILIGALEIWDYVFFITSLAISGLAVAAYPFMNVTWLCTHVYYRQLLNAGLNTGLEIHVLEQVDSMKWKYFLLTGALPMLVISLGFIVGPVHSSPQSASTLLGIVGLVGLAGFFIALMLFRAIQKDMELLRQLIWAYGAKQ